MENRRISAKCYCANRNKCECEYMVSDIQTNHWKRNSNEVSLLAQIPARTLYCVCVCESEAEMRKSKIKRLCSVILLRFTCSECSNWILKHWGRSDDDDDDDEHSILTENWIGFSHIDYKFSIIDLHTFPEIRLFCALQCNVILVTTVAEWAVEQMQFH